MATLIISPVIAVTLVADSQPVPVASQPVHTIAAVQTVGRVQVRTAPRAIAESLQKQPLVPPTPSPTHAPAPTVAPKPAPSAAPAPPVGAGPPADPNSVIGIIEAAAARWGVSGEWMVKIARCESGFRTNAYNPGGPYIGLFQFLQSTFSHNGGTNIYDAADQADIAAKMLAHGQAHQWSCA